MDPGQWPYSAIGRVQCRSLYGTGTLVGPHTVLTAAHLMIDEQTGLVDPAQLQSFDIAVKNGRPRASSRIVSALFGSETPSRTYRERDQDWALLTLEKKDFGKRFGWVSVKECTGQTMPRQLTGIGYSQDFQGGLTAGIDRTAVVEHRFPGFAQVFVSMDEDLGASGGPVFTDDLQIAGLILGVVTANEPQAFAGKQYTMVLASQAFYGDLCKLARPPACMPLDQGKAQPESIQWEKLSGIGR